MNRLRAGRPWLIASLLAGLVGGQAYAHVEQWRLGYRPFAHAPRRVPFSWDMFATAIERCHVEWSPALRIDGREVRAFSDLGRHLEWDPVFNHAESYEEAALAYCSAYGTRATRVRLTCFYPEGRTTRRELDCK